MAVCLRCSRENPEGARFCISCGAGLAGGCPHCGTDLPQGAVFCPACGQRADASGAGLPSEMETIKLVTILFADVVGSTAQAETMPPDEVRALMAEFFEAMIEEIVAEGGTVERLIGDAIMADFGVPVAREDDAVRAVKAAIRMLDRLARFNQDHAEDLRIQIRVGVNTGQVSTGGSLGERLMVMGDAVNVAARLEQSAEPDTIVIGERTERSVRAHFALRELQSFQAKGKAEALRAFVVEHELDRPATAGHIAPLIGRTSELARLDAVLRAVERDRKPHVVTIVGEPGAGKTRLATAFGENSGALVLSGRCAPLEGGLTLWPFRDILRERAGLSSDDSADTAFEKLLRLSEALPSDLSPDPSRTAGALGSTIGLESALESLSGLDPREIQRAMFTAWSVLFSGLARSAPLMVIVDDIHWADATTLEMLLYLSATIDEPVLFVCPTRPEFAGTRSDWIGRLRDLTTISLDPLEENQSIALAAHVLEGSGMDPALADDVAEKAGGNPLFIRELALCLLDEGDSRSDRDQVEVPDSIQSVIQSRLDLLPPKERLLIQKAAVVGRFFWESAVSRITYMPAVHDEVEDLIRRQIVVERSPSSLEGEAEYGFAHILIRDVAYESLPRRVRGETHAQVAAWLEERRGERVGEFAEILSHHYQSAHELLNEEHLRHRARAYCLLAARNALRRFATNAAESHVRRAVALSKPGDERIQALEAVGDLYSLTHHSDGAYLAYREALEELDREDPASRPELARLAGKAAVVPTRWWGTMDKRPSEEDLQGLIEAGLEASGTDGAATEARVLLHSSRAFACNAGYEVDDASESAELAVALAEELHQPDLLSLALDARAASLFPEGCWAQIHHLNLQRIEIVPRLRDVREICDAYGMAAVTSIRKGLYREGRDFATAELDRARHIDPGSYVQGLVWHLVGSFMLGEWTAVIRDQRELAALQATDEVPGSMAMRGHTAALFCRDLRGDAARAQELLDLYEAYRAVRQEDASGRGGQLETSGLGLPEAARFFARRGLFEEARGILSMQRDDFLSMHLEAWCEVVRLEGTWHEAPQILDLARREAEAQGLPNLTAFADRLDGARAAAQGDRDATALLSRSADAFAELAAPWEEAMSRLLLAEALQEGADPSIEAETALKIFQRLGSVEEVERAERVLARHHERTP